MEYISHILPSDPIHVCGPTSHVTSSRKPLLVLPIRCELLFFDYPQYFLRLSCDTHFCFFVAVELILSYLLHTQAAFYFLIMLGAVPGTDKYLLDLKLIFSHSVEFTLQKYMTKKGIIRL